MQFLYKNKNSKPIDFQLIKITFNIIFTNKTQEMLKIEKWFKNIAFQQN